MSFTQLLAGIGGSPAVYRVGWALIHSLWLGAAVAAVLSAALVMLRRRSANARYLAGCGALAATVVLVLGAFVVVQPRVEQASRQDSVHAAPLSPEPAGREARSSPNVKPGQQKVPAVRGDGLARSPKASAPAPAASTEIASATGKTPQAWTARVSSVLEPVLPWVVSAWSAGVCVLLVWHLGGWLAVGRLRRRAREPAEAGLVEVAARLTRALRISRPVRLLESAAVRIPTVAGWLRPAILLPVSLATGLTSGQIEAILAHELAHIRRHDYLVNLLQSLVETLFFYHPAVWWMSRRIRAERENACDDLAVAIGQERSTYAESLARTAAMAWAAGRGAGVLSRVTVGAVRRPSGLRERIFRLLDGEGGSRDRFPGSWPGVLATAAAILCSGLLLIHAAAGPGAPEGAPKGPSTLPAEASWSKAINGLEARVTLKRTEVNNGTPILSTFLELRNVSDRGNPMKLSWSSEKLKPRVIDDNGRELPTAHGSYDGPAFGSRGLVIPRGRTVSLDISCRGLGIGSVTLTGGGETGSETVYFCRSRRLALISLAETHVDRERRKFDPHRPGGCNRNSRAHPGGEMPSSAPPGLVSTAGVCVSRRRAATRSGSPAGQPC